jgi:alanine dehydrogenase
LLLGGVPGVPPGNVVIIGGGIVGTNAARIALGLGARVTLVDLNLNRLRELDDIFNGRLYTLASNSYNIGRAVCDADLVIGGVLIPGAAAPKLVTKEMVSKMKKGAVIVDVAIDQGGCIETARPTTHSDPSYLVDGVVHYCVTNMPAAVPNTSTLALTNATFPYLLKLARLGANAAIKEDPGLAEGVNTFNGILTCKPVAESQHREWQPVSGLV